MSNHDITSSMVDTEEMAMLADGLSSRRKIFRRVFYSHQKVRGVNIARHENVKTYHTLLLRPHLARSPNHHKPDPARFGEYAVNNFPVGAC